MSKHHELLTPILLKTEDDTALPEDLDAYLLLAGNGLWICRNHPFYTSCVPARNWPSELADHQSSLTLNHPLIPRTMLERIVGFFDAVALAHNSEAGVQLVWNRKSSQMELVVPPQVATISISYNGLKTYPIGLYYDSPVGLGPDRMIIGDVHSHVYDEAYSSAQDKYDEEYRPGLHLVIGRLGQEPPEFHAEYVVDGKRFDVETESILAGYQKRRSNVPKSWLRRVRIKPMGSGRVYPFEADVIAEEARHSHQKWDESTSNHADDEDITPIITSAQDGDCDDLGEVAEPSDFPTPKHSNGPGSKSTPSGDVSGSSSAKPDGGC